MSVVYPLPTFDVYVFVTRDHYNRLRFDTPFNFNPDKWTPEDCFLYIYYAGGLRYCFHVQEIIPQCVLRRAVYDYFKGATHVRHTFVRSYYLG
jgi:hypothetical protein